MKKVYWFYFSGTGNTRKMVELINKKIENKGDLFNHDNIKFETINLELLNLEYYFNDFFAFNFNENFFEFYENFKKNLINEERNELENYDLFLVLKYIFINKLFILSFPVYFYQMPKIVYSFLKIVDFIFINLKYENKIDIFILTTNGGLPFGYEGIINKKFRTFNIVYNDSLHFEDSHPGLRLKFNPFISKGYPSKKSFNKFKNKFLINFSKYLENKKEKSRFSKLLKGLIYVFLLPYIFLMQKIYNKKKLFLIFFKKNLSKKCNLCFMCINLCPTKIIGIKDNNNLVIDYDFCIGCYRCTNFCPSNAINGSISSFGIKYKRFMNNFFNNS